MKQLTPEQIQANWNKLIQLIKDTFPEDYPDNRREKLLNMYHYFEDRMCIAPASGKEHYHNAFVGGYVDHVLHVTDLALKINKLWKDNGASINYTDEELAFAAIHHDLGKVGDLENDYYVPNESDWHRKNQGLIYKHGEDLQFMTVTDRAIFLLNHFGVKYSEWEYIGLRLTDGLYEEANKNYYIGYQPSRSLKTNIAYVLHQADSMATHIEYDEWKHGEQKSREQVNKKVINIKKAVETEVETKLTSGDNAKDLFDELFGDKK
jgi:hypothetical protein